MCDNVPWHTLIANTTRNALVATTLSRNFVARAVERACHVASALGTETTRTGWVSIVAVGTPNKKVSFVALVKEKLLLDV